MAQVPDEVDHAMKNGAIPNAIRTFLSKYPIQPAKPGEYDGRVMYHPDAAAGNFGTVVLPLWDHTQEFHPGSQHWTAFEEFMQALAPVLVACAKELSESLSAECVRARNKRAHLAAAKPDSMIFNDNMTAKCFSSMRLSANQATTSSKPRTSHPSKWVALMPVGDFSPLELIVSEYGLASPLIAGHMHVLNAEQPMLNSLWSTGDLYQLEFFLPDPN